MTRGMAPPPQHEETHAAMHSSLFTLGRNHLIQQRIKVRRMRNATCLQRSVLCSCWSQSPSFSWLVSPVLDYLSVHSEVERLNIREYYVRVAEEYEIRASRMGWWLYHLQVIRTTFNLVLPALLAFQNLGHLAQLVMWLTWALSLMVSLATGYIDLFRMRDMYEQFTRASELLKLEGWRFFGLTGRYSVFTNHQDALPAFFERVARIRRRMIDEEFPPHKNGTTSSGTTARAAEIASACSVPPLAVIPLTNRVTLRRVSSSANSGRPRPPGAANTVTRSL